MSSVNSALPVGPGRIEFVMLVSVVMMIVAAVVISKVKAIVSAKAASSKNRWHQ